MIVTDQRVANYVASKISDRLVPPYICAGIEKDGRIVAGVVFNCFTGPDIEITVAADPGAITRAFVRQCGWYVFEQLGCERASITTEKTEVVRLAERLGGRVEGMKRNQYGPGRDGFLVGILKEEWAYR